MPVELSKSAKAIVVGAVALGVVALALLTIWLLPAWLTQHPRLSGPERHKAAADARTGVIALVGVLGALGGLYYTSRNFKLARDAQIAAQKQANETSGLSAQTLRLTERGQITDRYAKAVEMLGDPTNEICVGGIYALGHIMLDSPTYERAIVAVLSAFVRRRAKKKDDLSAPWPKDEAELDEVKPSFPIQAVLNVFAESRPASLPPDLRDSDLRGARLRGAQLPGASFRRSYLWKAKLFGANLSRASLTNADFTDADLTRATLTGANLVGAKFTDAKIANADFEGAWLTVGALTPEQLKTVRNGDSIIWIPQVEDPDSRPILADTQTPDPL
jgi:hypothetical protein